MVFVVQHTRICIQRIHLSTSSKEGTWVYVEGHSVHLYISVITSDILSQMDDMLQDLLACCTNQG